MYLSLVDQAARGKIVHVYENQEGHIALYNMLEYDKKKELAANLGDYYLLNLYRDLKDQGERTNLYKMLDHAKKEELVGRLGSDLRMQLYGHLKAQDEYINYIEMDKNPDQGESTKLYKMLINNDDKRELVINLDNHYHQYLYRDLKDQGKQTELYNMLKPAQQRALVRGLGSDYHKELYLSLKDQEKRIKLYNMLRPEHQEELSRSLSPKQLMQLRGSILKRQAQKLCFSCIGREPLGQQQTRVW